MTRSRIWTAVLGLALLASLYWVMHNTEWRNVQVPRPLRGEARTDPYYGAGKLARALGAHARTVRRLGEWPPPGTTLVLSSEFWNLFSDTSVRLKHWVEAGGHLVLDARLLEDEQLAWIDAKHTWKDVTHDGSHPHGCIALQVLEPPALPRITQASLCTAMAGHLQAKRTPSWALTSEGGLQALRHSIGKGRVTVVKSTLPLTARHIMALPHAWYFLLVTDLKIGDTVWFVPFEDSPNLLSLLWQHASDALLVALAVLALALWRAAPRFGPLLPATPPARRSLRDQIVGSGAFAARAQDGEVLLRAQWAALDSAARQRIPSYDAMAPAARIQALATLSGARAPDLTRCMTPGASPALGHKLFTLETVRRRLRIPLGTKNRPP